MFNKEWNELFNFHVFNEEQYFVLTVYDREIKDENLIGETRIGIISFKDQGNFYIYIFFIL